MKSRNVISNKTKKVLTSRLKKNLQFITDNIYQNTTTKTYNYTPQSVHHKQFLSPPPKPNPPVIFINSPSKKKYVFALSPNKIKISNIKKISLLKEDRNKNQISSRPSVSTRNTSKNISKYYEKVRNNNDNIEEIHFNFVKLLQREKKGINEDILI